MAVLLAVGLKYFLIEAYEIPTPSMQPTLMGSTVVGVHDRILVDKAIYETKEPKRWEVAVFRYPLNLSQNYVKRIVGVGGESYRIQGGDVYRVDTEKSPPAYSILRKPKSLQNSLWKRVWEQDDGDAARRAVDMANARNGEWHWDDTDLVATDKGAGAEIRIRPLDGFTDRYWHGYPDHLVPALRSAHEMDPTNTVGDLRFEVSFVPDDTSTAAEIFLTETPKMGDERRFRLRIEKTGGGATATLELGYEPQGTHKPRVGEVQELEDVTFEPGTPIRLVLANADDHLSGSVDGRAFPGIDYDVAPSSLKTDRVELSVNCAGGKHNIFRGACLARDIYYTDTEVEGQIIHVPEGHFWMLGDNTQNSADGRMWRSIGIAVDKDGRITDIGEAGPTLIGNARRGTPGHIDNDENPVVVESKHRIVFTDLWGNEHVVIGTAADLTNPARVVEKYERFVPRDAIIGRALLVFWPANPFGNFRLGTIR